MGIIEFCATGTRSAGKESRGADDTLTRIALAIKAKLIMIKILINWIVRLRRTGITLG